MHLFDTMRNRFVELDLRESGHVSIYACGPTVYDVPHLGHARTALTYDILKRYLQWSGYTVTLASNITDIDDKIISRSAEEGISEHDLTTTYTKVYIQQLREFGIADPDHRPQATEYVSEMIEIISRLIHQEAAYEIAGSGVYFSVNAFDGYGALVGRTAGDLRESAQARIASDEEKEDPLDFALWKAAKPGEPTWESPWGPGRPGWHIECVAMSLDILGEGFDIHGGGTDLAFPHHENERAEAEASGHAFARHWMHSAMLNVNGEKMAKSLGNFRTLGDALKEYGPRSLKLAMLQAHYRSIMELSDETMAGAIGGIERIDAFFRRMRGAGIDKSSISEGAKQRFAAAMNTDMGTPDAIAVIFETISAGNSALDGENIENAAIALTTVTELLGVFGLDQIDEDADSDIDLLLAKREMARTKRDFAAADEIRNLLQGKGVEIEDTPSGPIWRRL
jgi:cysteinyl-tRNA synthetase